MNDEEIIRQAMDKAIYACRYIKANPFHGIRSIERFDSLNKSRRVTLEGQCADVAFVINTNVKEKETYKDLCKNLKKGSPCLVRDKDNEKWECDIFAIYDDDEYPFLVYDTAYKQCLPYDGYREYLGTTKSPLNNEEN